MAKKVKKSVNTSDVEQHQVLESMKRLLPEGYSTNCTTAQQKAIQANIYDHPKLYWCCWVKDREGSTLFAMYDGENIHFISEAEKKKRIVKSVK
ncbi:MAG: hypothetical protein E7020_01010 [Alphaproteobacteria bacterium]|nr:hypothetical protein [Alphaproteobacteria bacterium]